MWIVQDSRSWLSARPDPLAPRSVPKIEIRHASRRLRRSCNQLARGCTWPRLESPHTFCHSQRKVYKNIRGPRELLRCPYSANRILYRPSPQSHFASAGLCSRGSAPRIAPLRHACDLGKARRAALEMLTAAPDTVGGRPPEERPQLPISYRHQTAHLITSDHHRVFFRYS